MSRTEKDAPCSINRRNRGSRQANHHSGASTGGNLSGASSGYSMSSF